MEIVRTVQKWIHFQIKSISHHLQSLQVNTLNSGFALSITCQRYKHSGRNPQNTDISRINIASDLTNVCIVSPSARIRFQGKGSKTKSQGHACTCIYWSKVLIRRRIFLFNFWSLSEWI
jgi:hypothetical protein